MTTSAEDQTTNAKTDPKNFLDNLYQQAAEWSTYDRFATIGNADSFFTKIVGVTFEERQDRIASLLEGDPLNLVRSPNNPFDGNAIEVRYGTVQMGFLKKEIAYRLAPNMDAGERYSAIVGTVTGGKNGQSIGINVRVTRENRVAEKDPSTGSPHFPPVGTVEDIRHALLGNNRLRQTQMDVMSRVDTNKNVLAVFGTGRGKSVCFQIPAVANAIKHGRKTVIFHPLRALANDQFVAMRDKLETLPVRILRANGSIEQDERDALYAALATGAWDIILATPEFATHHARTFGAVHNRPFLVVVDEAHHLHEARHRAAYKNFGELLTKLGNPQTAAFTATAGPEAFATIRDVLKIDSWVIDSTVRENLRIVEARNIADKNAYLARTVKQAVGKTIIYCNSRKEVVKVAERLRGVRSDVAFYHANVPRAERHQIEQMFRDGDIKVVVSTSAFGEGIDLPDVSDVVLYHLCFDLVSFNQMAGRAGRDGAIANIHLLYGANDRRINDYIINKNAPTVQTLQEIYRGMKGLATDKTLRTTYDAVSQILDIEAVDGGTVGIAARIFQEIGIVQIGQDELGRFVMFNEVVEKRSIYESARYQEGISERLAFDDFCTIAMESTTDCLQNLVNRPIFPPDIQLVA